MTKQQITASEANAIELTCYASTRDLELAYASASLHGKGEVCDIILRELDRRSGYDQTEDRAVAFREKSAVPAA